MKHGKLIPFLCVSFLPGIFDQDAPDPVLIARPTLYKQGRLGSVYKPYSFWINMGDALYQSLVIYFVAHWTYADTNVDIWEFGTVICTECLCVQNLHLAIETKSWVSLAQLLQLRPKLIKPTTIGK